MPLYQITSPQTNRTYEVDFTGTPDAAEFDEIWPQLDAHAAKQEEQKPFFGVGDTLSALGDAIGGLPTTLTSSAYRLKEGNVRPDAYSPAARAAFDAEAKFTQRVQQETQNRLMQGESSSAGDAVRAAAPSLGFSGVSMGASIVGNMVGRPMGALLGGAAGAPTGPGAVATGGMGAVAGGTVGGMALSGAAAYRMAGNQFLDEAWNRVGREREKAGLPWTEKEKQEAYNELLPLAQETGLWEAGPEAVGNAVGLGAGKYILGLGKKASTEIAESIFKRLGKKVGAGVGGLGTEVTTETITQLGSAPAQAQAQALAAGDPDWQQASSPYDRPGGTLQAVMDVAPATLAQSAMMLGAGGIAKVGSRVFSKPEDSPNAPLSPNQTATPTPTPAAAGAPAQVGAATPQTVSTLSRIAQESLVADLPEDTGALTAEEVQDLETLRLGDLETQNLDLSPSPPLPVSSSSSPLTPGERALGDQTAPDAIAGVNAEPAQTITGSNVQTGTEMPVPPPTAQAGAGAGATAAPRTPEQNAESAAAEEARRSQIAQLQGRMNQIGRGPVIPDSPLGVYDILDFVNENKIRVPRANSAERKAGEYDWTETYSVPQYYRKFLGSSERGGSIDQVAQAAFEGGFIREPTPDALMGAIQQTIDTRQQYRVQFAQQAKEQKQVEKQVLDFEKTQQTLRRKDKDQVRFEDIAPGDEMTIDGEQAVVKNIEYTEDGYLTNVVIEDGKRFGLMQFDPQTRQGIFVDEYTPKQREQPGTAEEPLFNRAAKQTPKEWAKTLPDADKTDRKPNEVERPYNEAFTPGKITADRYGDDPYIYRDEWIDVSNFDPRKSEDFVGLEGMPYEAVAKMPSTQKYIEWYQQGFFGPPITVVQNTVTNRGKSNNRRRIVAALEAGVTQIPARVEIGRASDFAPKQTGTAEEALFSRAARYQSPPGLAQTAAAMRGSPSPSLPVSPSPRLLNAYTAAARGSSTQMLPIRAVFDQAKAQNPALTPAQFMAEVQAGDRSGTVLLEPFDTPQGLQEAGEFVARNASGVPSTRMMVQSPSLPVSESPSLPSPATLAANQKANEAILRNLGLPTAKGTRVWGAAKVKAALAKLATDGRYPATTRRMALELSNLSLDNLLLKIEADARLNWAGLYQPFTDGRGELSLNTRVLGSGATDIGISLVHEALHHATYRALRNPKTARQKQAKADLEALFSRARSALAANEQASKFDYELSNLDEFITGLWTRADFQTALAGIPADQAPTLGERVRSMLDEIFRVLAELVTGKQVPTGSVLEASMAATLRIMGDGKTQAQQEATAQETLMNLAATPNETQSRFASPNAADRVINGPRTDELVAAEANAWLESLDQQEAIEAFARQQVPLPLDAAEHAAAVLISRLSEQASSGKTEVLRMWAHVQGQRMARIWTKEFLSADPARALRQRGVVNNTILAPIAPVMAAQELLTDRATKVIDARFDGGAEGVTEKIKAVVKKADEQASETLAEQLDTAPEEAPELGDNPDLQTGNDPRIADLEERLKQLRLQMAAGDAAMQETTSTWQKILELLNAASQRKSAMLTGARSRLALARKAALNRKAQRRAEGRLSANPVEDFADDAIIGTAFLAEGIVEFFNWGQAMIREVGARSNTELKQLYAAASKNYLDALKAEQVKPTVTKRSPAREKVNRAQRTAQSILDELSRRYSDPPIFAEGQRKVNAMRELYKAHVKNPMAESTFVTRAQELGANAGTAGTLWEAAKLEIEAREIMTREARRAKLNPLLAQNSPALAKLLNSLRSKIFPGMKWADIFMQLPSAQKERQREIYKRLMKDERLKALAPGERLQLTNELDKAWLRERRKVFMRELEKAKVLGEKKPKDREKVKAAAPRLLRLMNLGMLNSEMFREAMAKEYGLKMIDAQAAAELRALGERIQTAPEGLPRRKLEVQLMERLQTLAGTTFWQVMDSWWTASVLSGWRTQVDIGLSLANGIEDVGLGSIVTALRTGNKDVAVRGLASLFGRIPSAFMEAVDHVRTGNKALMRNFELEAKQALEGGNRLASDVGAQMWRDGGWRKVPGGFMIFYGRLMTALDHVNSASTREGAKAMALARHPELYAKALRISAADRQAARQQARLELTGGAEPATQSERLEETARVREILDREIPAEVIAEATEVGRAAALQGEPTGLGGALLDAVLGAVGIVNRKAQELAGRENPDRLAQQTAKVTAAMVPLARAITGTKFARTVAHSLNRTISYVPGIGVYAVGQQGRTGAFGDILAAKQVIGTLVGIALYLAFDDDDDEKGIEDSWKDKTPQQKAQLYAQGKQPFTIWERDAQGRVRSYNYQQWGVAGIVNTVAAMLKQKGSEQGTLNVLMSSLVQGGMSFTDKAQLQGLQTVFGENFRSTDPASGIAASVNKWAAQTVGGMVPRLYKDIEMVYNPELHQMNEWWQKWAKEVPMGRKLSSGKRVDILGADILLDRTPFSRVTQLGTADPVYRILGRLNEKDVWLPDPSQGVRIVKLPDGTRRPMTEAEKDRYQRITGQMYRDYLTEQGERLLQLPPDKAQEEISRVTEAKRARAAYQATH